MKRVSFFPLILLALTLILVYLFVFFSAPKQVKTTQTQVSAVSEGHYQEALASVLKKFFSVYDSATSDTVRAESVQTALNALLNMRVPASDKELHLELAIILQKMKQGITANPQDVSDGYSEIKDLISQTSWLHL